MASVPRTSGSFSTPIPLESRPRARSATQESVSHSNARKVPVRRLDPQGSSLDQSAGCETKMLANRVHKVRALALTYKRNYQIDRERNIWTNFDQIETRKCPLNLATRNLVQTYLLIKEKSNLGKGKYRIVEVLGSGTFGTAFRAESIERVHQQFVLKASHTFVESDLTEAVREAFLLGGLRDNPYVPKLVDSYPAANIMGLRNYVHVMEYQPLKELGQFIATPSSPITMGTISAFTWKMLDFLRGLHERGVFHLDIKPQNILIGENPEPSSVEELTETLKDFHIDDPSMFKTTFLQLLAKTVVKVIDFGSSKTQFDTDANRYFTTAWYRHPSVVAFEGFAPEFDYFSLGATLFELYTGKQLLSIGDVIIQILEKHGVDTRDAVQRNYVHQLVRLHVTSVILKIPKARAVEQMRDHLRSAYYERLPEQGNEYTLKPLPFISEKISNDITRLLAHEKIQLFNSLSLAMKEKEVPLEVHQAFCNLLFRQLLSDYKIEPEALLNHEFFKLVAMQEP